MHVFKIYASVIFNTFTKVTGLTITSNSKSFYPPQKTLYPLTVMCHSSPSLAPNNY